MADTSQKAFAIVTSKSGQCSDDHSCIDRGGLCINASDQSEADYPEFKKAATYRLCCSFQAKGTGDLYPCKYGVALSSGEDIMSFQAKETRDLYPCKYGDALSSGETIISCTTDKDCNGFEEDSIAKCPDRYTYMRTELECEKPRDCMKGQVDESGAEERALCAEYFERNVAQKKRCCPIGQNVNAYCTRRKCYTFSDCNAGAYCDPWWKVCCYIGETKLDGSQHEKGEICQGSCSDKELFGKKIPQYCVRTSTADASGFCFLSPYLRVKDRDRTVNPVYNRTVNPVYNRTVNPVYNRTVIPVCKECLTILFTVSVILTVVFAFINN
ncbi:unnamed protein product [Strongylus vulgaris]|uniref:Uncharacterized protein n=1 Tax=Strongylus vulgaris TaxID=40348 RepID=A0A3P7J6W2_STRVU|nr:unnamed protein product [Strongylus vulgaris]